MENSKNNDRVINKLATTVAMELRDDVSHLPKVVREKAIKSLEKLHQIEQEKIDSGEWEWVDIEVKHGPPTKALRKIKTVSKTASKTA